LTTFLKTMASVAIGVALGLLATWFAVERGYGFGAVNAGPWIAWPNAGSPEADPYARAVIARSAAIPLGLAEGLLFVARADSQDRELDPACDYRIRGRTPPARYWTLNAATPEGFLIPNAVGRYGFTSSEIVREDPEIVDIVAAREARAGNWLPIAGTRPFVLAFRLYDTIVRASARGVAADNMPSITRERCG
jgi:hypothetical protein